MGTTEMPLFRGLANAFLFFALLSTPALAASWEGVFEGTLGKSKIIVELYAGPQKSDYAGGEREGSRYSYFPRVRDINLVLTDEGKVLSFAETPLDPFTFSEASLADRKITGLWSVAIKNKTASGTWTSADGKKTLPINLKRVADVSDDDVVEDGNILTATYDALWLKSVNFTEAGTPTRFGEVALHMVKDSVFGTEYPVISKFPNAAGKVAINAMLMNDYRQSVVGTRNCKNGLDPDVKDEPAGSDFAYSIDYASPRVLSITEAGSVFCGGAHPNNYAWPTTYDLLQRKQITSELSPDGFGQVLKLGTRDERIAFEHFALERWITAAEQDKEMGQECMSGFLSDRPWGDNRTD